MEYSSYDLQLDYDGLITPNDDKLMITITASKINNNATRKTGTSFSVKDEGTKRLDWRGLGGLSIGIAKSLVSL
jgi:hypothetical protein